MNYNDIICAKKMGGGTPAPEPTLVSKNITDNGIYDPADDNADGYSDVTVNVTGQNNAKVISTPTAFTIQKNLQSIVVPEGVTALDDSAFVGCTALTSVSLPGSLRYIGDYAFRYCPFSSVEIPEGVTTIDYMAFMDCDNLETLTIPSTITTINAAAIERCTSLKTITIHKAKDSIPYAPWGAPADCEVIWTG